MSASKAASKDEEWGTLTYKCGHPTSQTYLSRSNRRYVAAHVCPDCWVVNQQWLRAHGL